MTAIKTTFRAFVASSIFLLIAQGAAANERLVTTTSKDGITTITHAQLIEAPKPKTLFIPAVYSVENAWNAQDYDFTKNVPEPASAQDTDYAYETPVGLDELSAAYGGGKQVKSDGKEFVDGIMNKVPYKNTLKHTWNVIDGDVDLVGVTNLRVNRRNKGVMYKTNHVPLVGEVEGTEIRADAGDDTKLTLTSDRLPFGGRVDGLQFKASVGNDDSNISLRYKRAIALDLIDQDPEHPLASR